MSIELYKKFKR